MKSFYVNKGAGLADLTIKEHDVPVPGPREVLVRVRANSLNQRELMVMHRRESAQAGDRPRVFLR